MKCKKSRLEAHLCIVASQGQALGAELNGDDMGAGHGQLDAVAAHPAECVHHCTACQALHASHSTRSRSHMIDD